MRRIEQKNEKSWSPRTQGLPRLAASLDRIYKKVKAEGFAEDNDNGLDEDIRCVRERFAIGERAAVLLAAILENNARNGCDDDDLSGYIGCSNIEFIGFQGALRELEDLDIINRRSRRGDNYVMGREALRAVEKDTDFRPMKRSGLEADEFFSRIRLILADFDRDLINCDRMLEEMVRLIDGNQHLEFCRKAYEALETPGLCDTEKRFFLLLCHRYVSHGEESFPIDRLLTVSDYMEDDIAVFVFDELYLDTNPHSHYTVKIRHNAFAYSILFFVKRWIKICDCNAQNRMLLQIAFFLRRKENPVLIITKILQLKLFRI